MVRAIVKSCVLGLDRAGIIISFFSSAGDSKSHLEVLIRYPMYVAPAFPVLQEELSVSYSADVDGLTNC
jgi:hypothetical protein